MGRVLAVDYGRRRIGLAISDELNLTSQGLSTLQIANLTQAVEGVVNTVKKWDVEKVVVGLPLNMDGSRGSMVDAVDRFVLALKGAVMVPIVLMDERLTSVAAQRVMCDLGVKMRGHKGMVDRISATLLLQTFLQQTNT
jgi:putative Holliday junction resolvase